jgi:DNA replication protein DnaD
MDSMVNGGWVKLYRELKSKSIWQLSSPEQKVVLITILLLANHEENKWEWKGEQFVCKPGQLITSLNSLVRECGDGVTIQNVRTALDRFQKLGFLTNVSTKTGRLITILNWEKYQGNDFVSNKGSNKALTKSQQRPNKDLTPNKNDKEYKNDKEVKNIKPSAPSEDEILDREELYGVDPAEQYRRFLAGELNLKDE